jgi:hypothetical protein
LGLFFIFLADKNTIKHFVEIFCFNKLNKMGILSFFISYNLLLWKFWKFFKWFSIVSWRLFFVKYETS